MSQEFVGNGHWLDIKKRPSHNNIVRIVNGNGVIMEMNTFSGDVVICRGDERINSHYEELSETLAKLGISPFGWQAHLRVVGKEGRIDPLNLPWSDTAADELYEEIDRERKASLEQEKKGSQTMQTVQLSEEGDWDMSSWSSNPDDDEWIGTGWQVRTYDGNVLFRHDHEASVRQWLKDNEYQPVGDGWHFQK